MDRIKPFYIALGLSIAYAVLLSALSILQHEGLRTQMNDLGNADQALWAAASGDLSMTQSNDMDGKLRSRIGVHANFIFYPLSLLYLIWPDPRLLLGLTSIACAAAGMGLYAIARHRLGDTWWSVIPAAVFLMSPIVHDSNLYDFHIITVATALLVWTFWAFDTGHRRLGWLLFILLLLCNEDIALVTMMFGFYLALRGSRHEGLLIMGLSLLYFILVVYVAVPLFNEGLGPSKLEGSANRYSWLSSNSAELFIEIFKRPLAVIKHIIQPDRLRLPLYLLISGGIVGLSAWPVLLISLPQIMAALLANGIWMTRITGTYYWVISDAIIVIACILSAEKHMRNKKGSFSYHLLYLGIVTVVLSVLLSPLPHGIFSSWDNYAFNGGTETLAYVIRVIPEDASVCVQNNLGPHLSQRHDIASYPRRCDNAEYALFHLRYVGGPDTGLFVQSSQLLFTMSPYKISSVVYGMLLSDTWGLVYQKDGFYLFRRGAESVTDTKDALIQFRQDYEIFMKGHYQSSRHWKPFSYFLINKVAWDMGVFEFKHIEPFLKKDP
jgi:uncharacterized membrane protein